jgi:hypothetical protein
MAYKLQLLTPMLMHCAVLGETFSCFEKTMLIHCDDKDLHLASIVAMPKEPQLVEINFD